MPFVLPRVQFLAWVWDQPSIMSFYPRLAVSHWVLWLHMASPELRPKLKAEPDKSSSGNWTGTGKLADKVSSMILNLDLAATASGDGSFQRLLLQRRS